MEKKWDKMRKITNKDEKLRGEIKRTIGRGK